MAYRYPVHRRINHWKIGEYDTITRQGEIIVGQLCQINFENSVGIFRGFVVCDMQGKSRENQSRDWKHHLCTSEPRKINDRYIKRYEALLDEFENQNKFD